MIKEIINKVEKETVFTLEPHLAVFSGFSNIDNTRMKHRFSFSSNEDAFDFSVGIFKSLLFNCGYQENNNLWEK
jgi:hypothetical protein